MTNLKVDANILSLEGIDQKIEADKERKKLREEGKEKNKIKKNREKMAFMVSPKERDLL